jgi:hypothetical protein
LVRKPEGRKPLERPRCRWEDIIKMAHWEVGWVDMDWINLAWDRWWVLMNAVNPWVPLNTGEFLD